MNLWRSSRKFYMLRAPINRKSTMIGEDAER